MRTEVEQPPNANPNVVCQTVVDGAWLVSTINLADAKPIDAALSMLQAFVVDDDGRADLSTPGEYETMVFPCDADGEVQDWGEQDFARYFTKDEALAGHTTMCEKWEGRDAA